MSEIRTLMGHVPSTQRLPFIQMHPTFPKKRRLKGRKLRTGIWHLTCHSKIGFSLLGSWMTCTTPEIVSSQFLKTPIIPDDYPLSIIKGRSREMSLLDQRFPPLNDISCVMWLWLIRLFANSDQPNPINWVNFTTMLKFINHLPQFTGPPSFASLQVCIIHEAKTTIL